MNEPREWTWTGDSSEDDFRFRAFMEFGFDVDDYDAWLRGLPACPARDELAAIRAEAKAEGMHGRALKRLLHMLWASRQAIKREGKLLPLAEEGSKVKNGRSTGGKKTAQTLKREAAARDKRLLEAALKIRNDEPRIKRSALAATLADRGHGGSKALEKKLARLLPKKSTEPR